MAPLKLRSEGWRAVVVLVHLSMFAQLGVLTRAMLDKFFMLGCSGGWGPCLAGGIWFKDLGSNMLGCFVIGLFAASSVLGLATSKALALLPARHAWQGNLELQLGIRTGYCGSLTTFASWQLELITAAVEHSLWMNALLGFIMGLYAAIMSYAVGCHTALLVDRWLLKEGEDVLSEQQQYRTDLVDLLHNVKPGSRLSAAAVALLTERSALDAELEDLEPDVPRNVLLVEPEPEPLEDGSTATSAEAGMVAGLSKPVLRHPSLLVEDGRLASAELPAEAAAQAAAGAVAGAADGGAGMPALGAERSTRRARGRWSFAQLAEHLRGSRTDLAVALLWLAFAVAFAFGVAYERRHAWLRQVWIECLMGPFGCILRWWLSRFNYKLPGRWAWFPAGTFAANMLGTAITFSMQCIIQRVTLSYWGSLVVPAVQMGFCGALTTVSTYVTELVKFQDVFPEHLHSYTYALGSLVAGAVLGLALYGWSVWA